MKYMYTCGHCDSEVVLVNDDLARLSGVDLAHCTQQGLDIKQMVKVVCPACRQASLVNRNRDLRSVDESGPEHVSVAGETVICPHCDREVIINAQSCDALVVCPYCKQKFCIEDGDENESSGGLLTRFLEWIIRLLVLPGAKPYQPEDEVPEKPWDEFVVLRIISEAETAMQGQDWLTGIRLLTDVVNRLESNAPAQAKKMLAMCLRQQAVTIWNNLDTNADRSRCLRQIYEHLSDANELDPADNSTLELSRSVQILSELEEAWAGLLVTKLAMAAGEVGIATHICEALLALVPTDVPKMIGIPVHAFCLTLALSVLDIDGWHNVEWKVIGMPYEFGLAIRRKYKVFTDLPHAVLKVARECLERAACCHPLDHSLTTLLSELRTVSR